MIVVRKAVPPEAQALAALDAQHAMSAGWNCSAFQSEFQQPQGLLLVAEAEGGLLGFVCARVLPPEVQMLNMAVGVSALRRGVATKLLSGLFALCRAEGCDSATLEARASNAPALACYAKSGFRIVGKRPKFYNGTEDAVLMDAPLL